MVYQPLGQRIVGILPKQKEKKVGSIYIAGATELDKYDEINVVEVGRGYISQSGAVVPMQTKVGDKVLVAKGTALTLPIIGDEVFDIDNEYVVFQESDIIVRKYEG